MQMDEPGMQMLDGVADMVSIQPEATVSRTAMRTEGGNVVLFAFDSGQELSEHTCRRSYRCSVDACSSTAATTNARWPPATSSICRPDCRTR